MQVSHAPANMEGKRWKVTSHDLLPFFFYSVDCKFDTFSIEAKSMGPNVEKENMEEIGHSSEHNHCVMNTSWVLSLHGVVVCG